MPAEEEPFHVPEKTLYQYMLDAGTSVPDLPGFTCLDDTVSYREALDMTDRVSASLSESGVGKGDRVMVCLHNCIEAISVIYACSRLGAIAVMVHPQSSREEIPFYAEDTGALVAFINESQMPAFERTRHGRIGRVVVVPSPEEDEPALPEGIEPWEGFLASGDGPVPETPEISPWDPVAVMYTGGTTGINKGAIMSSMNFNSSALGMLRTSGIDPEGQTMLAVLPFFHGFGLCTGIHLPLTQQKEAFIIPKFSPEAIAVSLLFERPSIIFGVPTLFEKLLDADLPEDLDLSFITGVFCGGDSLSPESEEAFDSMLREHGSEARIRTGYGCTESLSAITIMPESDIRPGSVGRPLAGSSISIVSGTGEEVPAGESGEICISGPQVMMGYMNRPDEDGKVLRKDDDGKVWLHTGDLGHKDSNGYLYFEERIKRMIVSSGYNVYPSEIEKQLNKCPLVYRSYVIGVKDPRRGSRIRAYVIPQDGTGGDRETADSIANFVAERVTGYARPMEYVFVDSFPMTGTGKVSHRLMEKDVPEDRVIRII